MSLSWTPGNPARGTRAGRPSPSAAGPMASPPMGRGLTAGAPSSAARSGGRRIACAPFSQQAAGSAHALETGAVADTFTFNYGWTKPDPGASDDTWGDKLNADLDAIDAQVRAIADGFREGRQGPPGPQKKKGRRAPLARSPAQPARRALQGRQERPGGRRVRRGSSRLNGSRRSYRPPRGQATGEAAAWPTRPTTARCTRARAAPGRTSRTPTSPTGRRRSRLMR